MSANTLILLALLPAVLIIIYIYRKDKVEKEPWGLIIKLMIFGALSCIPASFMESFVDAVVPVYPEGSLPYALQMAFLSAALCEEICKFVLLRLGSWRNPEFGYRFDGIVYGVAVAVGFAALENVLYVLQYGFETAIIRGLMAVPLHAFCGVYMGIFYGAAKQASVNGRSSGRLTLLALGVPMLIHGVYDTLAFLNDAMASIILLAFVLLMYIVSIRYVRKFSRDDWKSGFYPETQPLSDMGTGRGGAAPGGYSYGAGSRAGAGGSAAGSSRSGGSYNYGSTYGRSTEAAHPHPGEVHNGRMILVCPHCRRGLRVPAGRGRIRVLCPHCGKEFIENT